jgi:tRNA pseudouridine32 synthase/23S rRNA pseudouridine746 synthase
MEQGKVVDDESVRVTSSTPYYHGKTIHYYREVETENVIPFQESILFQNDHLLVADKPHFLPVTPTGPSVNECLLSRLQRRTGIKDLSPIHRLDRDTAGVVMFSVVKATRHVYHNLFVQRKAIKKYIAVASTAAQPDLQIGREWSVENRLAPGDPWFRMKITDGPVNALTKIVLTKTHGDVGVFELFPATGKKHQLRIHMASIGFPIVNDCFYPELDQFSLTDYSRPLQLLAKAIEFTDPVTGRYMQFETAQNLAPTRFAIE